MYKFFCRSFALLLSIILISAAVPADASSFASLSQLQQYLEKHSPDNMLATGPHYAELEGTIQEIHWCGANNHYEMTLQVEDPKALAPTGSDVPLLTVHFRLHLDSVPFKVGDIVTVFGTVNELYSSVMIPWVLAKTINGSEDF